MKKFISLALVLALALCFSLTAFAEPSPDKIFVDPADPENSDITNVEVSATPPTDAEMLEMANDPSTDAWLDKVPSATPADNVVNFVLSLDVTSTTGNGETLVFENLDQYIPAGSIVLFYLDGVCVYAAPLSDSISVPFPHFSRVDVAYMNAVPTNNGGSTTTTTATGKVCPNCGKTTVELVDGKFHCTSCQHTWTEYTASSAASTTAGGPTSPKTGDAGVAAALVVALMAGVGVCAFARKDENC